MMLTQIQIVIVDFDQLRDATRERNYNGYTKPATTRADSIEPCVQCNFTLDCIKLAYCLYRRRLMVFRIEELSHTNV